MIYPSSYYDINPIHNTVHLQQMRDIATDEIQKQVPNICQDICSNAIQNAFNNALNGLNLDVKRIVDVTCKQLNADFHSEEVTHFICEAIKAEIIKSFNDIDLKMIIS